MEYVLQTKSLGKKYGSCNALQELTMNVPKGSIYGFVGKNGAGKTTLFRQICGLQEPTAGEYFIYGKSHKDKDIMKVRRRMGIMVESPSLYGWMTAENNLKEQYRVRGLPSFDGIPELLKLVGLEDTGKKRVRHFSYGMRQRLGIAMALAGSPDFLVLDEPLNGLDPQGIIEIRELLLKLNRKHGVTILLSSHILDELAKLATHFGFIDKGTLIQEISAKELEGSFQKQTHISVSNAKILSQTLDETGLDYTVLSDTEANVFGDIDITNLVLELAARNCRVISIQSQDESLENYFINLVGDKKS